MVNAGLEEDSTPDPYAESVTLLLTDVEGSTRMWERSPVAMHQALARHDQIISDEVSAASGVLVKTRGEGDSTFSVFADPRSAIRAAIAIQQRLHSEPWPSMTPLRARAAIHCGPVRQRADDYYGPAVNRCARLRAAAHGGQVLVSMAGCEAIGRDLPEEVTLHSLGRHRLKDLAASEQIFQLCHPSLPDDFPPIRSAEQATDNLPLFLTSFVGRQVEIDRLRALVVQSRLVTLTGTGGCGKSRLALELARTVTDDYQDGVWLVELAPLTDAELVPQAIALAVGVRDEHFSVSSGALASTAGSMMKRLLETVRRSRMLIILDNCEHLIEACAEISAALTASAPHLTMLCTSREPLRVPGEVNWRVPSLSIPQGPGGMESLDELIRFDAVRLFVDRAKLNHPEFTVPAAELPVLVDVCRELDGIPLAIELAAARVGTLSISQMLVRLQDRFRLLGGGARTAPQRQQTIRATVEWSHSLLSPEEQTMLARLSVFVRGFTIEAAEAVCSGYGIDEFDVLELVSRLVDKSLVVPPDLEEHPRYRLLVTIRAFAAEKLANAGATDAVRERHRDYFLAAAESTAPELGGGDQVLWLDALERDHHNLRAALEWTSARHEPELLMRLAVALWRFWYVRGYASEGRRWLEEGIAAGAACDLTLQARALAGAGRLAAADQDARHAQRLLERSRDLASQAGDDTTLWLATAYLAQVFGELGDAGQAHRVGDEGLALARGLNDRSRVALSLISTGRLAFFRGDYDEAQRRLTEGTDVARQIGDQRNLYVGLQILGDLACELGDVERSLRLLDECRRIGVGVASPASGAVQLSSTARAHLRRDDLDSAAAVIEDAEAAIGAARAPAPPELVEVKGDVARHQGRAGAARDLHREALRLLVAGGQLRGVPRVLEACAGDSIALAAYADGLVLYGAAAAARALTGARMTAAESAAHDAGVTAARSALPGDCDELLDRGVAMSVDDAVALALGNALR